VFRQAFCVSPVVERAYLSSNGITGKFFLNHHRENPMRHQDNCVFCKIVRRQIPADKVYEDELTMAFMDIRPANEGHTLVIAREHFENLLDIDEPTLAAVAVTSQRIALAIHKALQPDGIRVSQFNGAAAGQSVFHYHLHIVPVRAGQQIGSHGRRPGNPAAIKQVAEKIRAALAG
jgi:histidine triad (HIT) family protein